MFPQPIKHGHATTYSVDADSLQGDTLASRALHRASSSRLTLVEPPADRRADDVGRLALAERHARLLDRFITQYADDTGKKATDKSVRKVAAATVSLFKEDADAKTLFNPRDNRSWLQKKFGWGEAPPRRQDGKLYPRKHEGVGTVRDFSRALGSRAEGRLEHFHRVIQADPDLLKTKMGMFSRSTSDQRLKMRSIAAGLLVCGFSRNAVAYAMNAMRAAINKNNAFDAKLDEAYTTIKNFIQSGEANQDFGSMVTQENALTPAAGILWEMGQTHLEGDAPDLLRGVIKESKPWPEEAGNAAPAGAISKYDIDRLKEEAVDVHSDHVDSDPKYLEQQSGALCGKHAANAYLHGNVITEQSLAGFLKLNSFWKDPDLKSIDDEATFDPVKGNDPDNIRYYLNYLNVKGKLGDNQRPLVTNDGTDSFSGYNIANLKENPPTDSHMMYYSYGRGFKKLWPEFAHFVAFHSGEDGDFRLYDSKSLGGRLPKKDPVAYAESCFTGPQNSEENRVVIVRPATDVFEARREFALAMTIDQIQQLNGTRMRLLESFLQKVTDPGRQFENGEKRQQFCDKLRQTFPRLSNLADEVDGMGVDARPMAEERQDMRQLVDRAAAQIAQMDRPDQLRFALVLGRYDAAQARQNYAEHVVQQRYPSLSAKQVEPIGTAIEKEMKNDKVRWPEDHVLEADDCAALERIAMRMANRMFGPPQVAPPPQVRRAPPPLAAAGTPPAHDYTVPDYKSDEEK